MSHHEINLVADEPVYAYHISYVRGERRIVEHVHGSMVVENAGGLSIYRNGICIRHYQPAAAAVVTCLGQAYSGTYHDGGMLGTVVLAIAVLFLIALVVYR